VVDDERPGRRKLVRFLSECEGIRQVLEAPNGRLAVEVIREFEPDLVCLDIQMPDLDGFAVLESLTPEARINRSEIANMDHVA
jgi:two-component system LytT family response regulator